MSELLRTARGAIILDIPSLVRFRDAGDVFRRGVVILALVGLVVGAADFAAAFIGALTAPPLEAQLDQMRQVFDQVRQFAPPEAIETFEEQFMSNFEVGIRIGQEIEALPTQLPPAVGDFFLALSAWVARPLTMLGGFLAYGIWVMLAAKLLGGSGRLQEFLGVAALSSVPYLLLVLNWVPCLGGLLGFVAWVWSLLIWIAATAVSQGWAVPQPAEGDGVRYQVSWGKALLAVILPALALVAVVVIVLTAVLMLVLVLSAVGSGG